jgi:hypothetical protein
MLLNNLKHGICDKIRKTIFGTTSDSRQDITNSATLKIPIAFFQNVSELLPNYMSLYIKRQ